MLALHVLQQVHQVYGQHQATAVRCTHAICTVFAGNRPYALAVLVGRTIDHLYPILGSR